VKIYKKDDASKTAVWSYHIWVSDYTPDDPDGTNNATYTNTYNTNNNGSHFVFMDRNLGATKAGTGNGFGTGLFYQWGRKDPFPSTRDPGANQLVGGTGTFTATAISSTTGTIVYTIQHPGEFITSEYEYHYDWYWDAPNNKLWGYPSVTAKTIYDPCPAGWLVPKFGRENYNNTNPWHGLVKDNGGTWNSGWTWDSNAKYPVAGRIEGNSNQVGKNVYSGTIGFYWSASPETDKGYEAACLYFNSTLVKTKQDYGKANGHSIRCVQEP
jgi:uncharacterized protein (TIGR02145 family)